VTSTSNKQRVKYRKSSVSKRQVGLEIGDEIEFEITYPESSDGAWKVTCDAMGEDFENDIKRRVKKEGATTVKAVLAVVCAVFAEYDSNDGGGDDDDAGVEDDGFDFAEEPVRKTREAQDPDVDTSKFQIPANYALSAVQAIAKELSAVSKGTRAERGFDAVPLDGQIHVWEVKVYEVAKDEPLWADMQKLKIDCITMQVTFAPNYPFAPPFIRVIRPRFAFRTGHVTMGGAICTLVLSAEGWNPLYRLEQIIIDIRANFVAGAGRLDMSNRSDYTEAEAMDAFRRLLQTHGWTHWKK